MFHKCISRYETYMSHKIDKRVAQTEEAIAEAGIRTLMSNSAAGMSEIAIAAGIGRATLYRHFKSREALIKKLALDCYEEFDAAFAPYEHLEGRAAIAKVFEVAMPMAWRFNFLIKRWPDIEDDEDLKRIDAQAHHEMSYLFDQARLAGDIDKRFPDVWLLAFFDSLIAAGCALVDSGDASPEQAANYVIRSFFEGCSKPGAN